MLIICQLPTASAIMNLGFHQLEILHADFRCLIDQETIDMWEGGNNPLTLAF